MSDATPVKATPAKAKKAAKPKKPADHPKYIEMVKQAIGALKERGGSSKQAIVKYIMANFNVGKDSEAVNRFVKVALKSGVAKGSLKQPKGTGASGSFRLGEADKKPKKPKAKKAAGEKKPKAKKPKTPKKKAAAKPKKSPAKKKAAAKPKKSPAKKKAAAKPKKSPAKKAAKKTKSPKKAAKK